MSTNTPQLPPELAWLASVGSGYVPENAVENKIRIPYAQVYNGSPGSQGADGGLFIKKSIVQEFFGGIENVQINPKAFVECVAKFENDKTGEITQEEGWIAKSYRLIILGTDHNARGYPQARKEKSEYDEEKDRWFFSVCAYIREFFNADLPFKLTYGGAASAIGMSQLIRQFDEYIVGNVTTMRRKLVAADASPVARNEFYMPVVHCPEYVRSKKGKASWCCPVQPFGIDPEKWSFDTEFRKSGEPTLKAFKMTPALISHLFLQTHPGGEALIALCKEAAAIYPKEVCINTDEKNPEAATGFSGSMPDFIAADDKKTPPASPEQLEFIAYLEIKLRKLAVGIDYSADGEIQVMIGASEMKGDAKSNVLFLSKGGAHKLIDHLKALVKQHGGEEEKAADKPNGEAPVAPVTAAPVEAAAPLPPARNAAEALGHLASRRAEDALADARAEDAKLPAGMDNW